MSRRGSLRRKDSKLAFVIGAVSIIVLSGVSLYLAKSSNRNALDASFNDFLAQSSNVVNSPLVWARNGANFVQSYLYAAEKVRNLEAQNKALLEWRNEAKSLAERLTIYEKLNNINSERSNGSVIARLIAESSGPFSRSGLINAGKNQGVGTDWVVINQYGLVGRVISVGQNSSRVLLLNDGASRIPIMGEDSRGRAVMIGDKTNAPFLSQLNIPNIISKDERLLTSGDDGVIPRGIVIGTAGIAPDKKWRVRLATNSSAIDFVKIIAPNKFIAPNDRVTNPSFFPEQPSPDASLLIPLNEGAAPIPLVPTAQAIKQAQELRNLPRDNQPKQAEDVKINKKPKSVTETNLPKVKIMVPANPEPEKPIIIAPSALDNQNASTSSEHINSQIPTNAHSNE